MARKIKAAVVPEPSPDGTRNEYYVHPGDFPFIAGFNVSTDKLILDSGTGVYDGLLPPFGQDIHDGMNFWNSKETAYFSITGSTDTLIECRVQGNIVLSVTLLGVAPFALHGWNIYGG